MTKTHDPRRAILIASMVLSGNCALAQGTAPTSAPESSPPAASLHDVRLDAMKEIQEKDTEALRLQLAAVDKRVDDLSTHMGQGVDRLGVYASMLGILITVLLGGLGVLGFISVTRKTRAEAQEAAKAWLTEKAGELEKRLQDIENKALQTQKDMENSARTVREHEAIAKKSIDKSVEQAIESLQMSIGQSDKPLVTIENQAAIQKVRERDSELASSPESSYSFDDWNTRAHAAYATQKLEEAAVFWLKASQVPNAGAANVAQALFNRGVAQGQMGQSEAEIATYNELWRRFGEATEPALQKQAAKAMVNKGHTQGEMGQSEAAMATYNELLRRFGEATEPALREVVAAAMVNKGHTQGKIGQSEAAMATYNELWRRFGEATEPALQAQVANAHNSLGFLNICDGKAHWPANPAQSKSLWQASLGHFDMALDKLKPTHLDGSIMGNRAYALALLGEISQAEVVFAKALRVPVNGGKTLYDATLMDFEIHPIALDQPMRELVERQWSIWQTEHSGVAPNTAMH